MRPKTGLCSPSLEIKPVLPPPDSKTYQFAVSAIYSLARFYYRMRFEGLDRLPDSGPAILVSNHQSYLDIILLGAALLKRRLIYQNYWVIGKATSKMPVYKILFDIAPLIVVNGTVKKAEWALKQGNLVTIFPEGYYTWHCYKMRRQGKQPNITRKIGNSAAILGLKTGCPMIPIKLEGTEEFWPPYTLFPKPGKLTLTVGESFRLGQPEPEEVTEEMIAEKAQAVMQRVDRL